MIALIGMMLASAGSVWTTDVRRTREAELLFIGHQYKQAIRSYYELDSAHQKLPQSIDDLLEDKRQPSIVRHLRRAYRDPFTGEALDVIRATDSPGIVGVVSRASGNPLKKSGFLPEYRLFAEAGSYADWRFEFVLPTPQVPSTPPRPAPVKSQGK